MRSVPLFWFRTRTYAEDFPPVELALAEPDGLLAAGGDLAVGRLLRAYRLGLFPWYSAGQPILWWSPDPRTILFPDRIKVSRSLRRTLARAPFMVTWDHDFPGVVRGCAASRRDGSGTWLTAPMIEAYTQLHSHGCAHSVECRHGGELVGGLYGVSIGRVFFGESMFSRMSNASKVGLVYACSWLQTWGYRLIDCQVHTAHLESLGATHIPRKTFTAMLEKWCAEPPSVDAWRRAPAIP
ncbi:MAG: leucyl/phenylalanyl-tRNA--protein transferase [Chromatiales bacterium]